MPSVTKQMWVECGKPARHRPTCTVEARAAATFASGEHVLHILDRKIVKERLCGCPAEVDSDRPCPFQGELDCSVYEEERTIVWTCPRCFAVHSDGI